MAETSAQKRHRHYGRTCYQTECAQTPLVARNGDKRCRCQEGLYNGLQGECIFCFGHPFADWEWELLDGRQENGGFVETESEDIFPVTVMVYLNTHGKENAGEYVKIANVRESSISIEMRKGIQTLVCESFVTERIAYVPNAVWYMTECQSGVQPY